ncbi:hypothetical protein [Halobacteroides halobius]|uniref:hypothetical protein n=1 Tax=Halobacteroides halobius TaxID=42422 RepID=UPI0012E9FD93|nr:hypothetical protein [Halobacteroides halobius]
MTNIFFINQENIYMPKQELGLLPGIIRNKVLDLMPVVEIEEVEYKRDNEIFAILNQEFKGRVYKVK